MAKCPSCGRSPKRSNEANRRYWTLLNQIADELLIDSDNDGTKVRYTADTWHEYFKGRFLGVEELPLPNGQIYKRVRSSAECETSEFAKYMESVESWAAKRGVYLDDIHEQN